MDHYSILDHSSSSPSVLPPPAEANRSATASVSAGIAAANARLGKPGQTAPRFPGEDAGRSLAEMAHADLDAALQLLAERAQYITGASGAAIALRRSHRNDMLCRATAGSNAPELGALLSTEHGLSGECVRTRKLLRCDDAAHDPRVNREVCLALGIASVIVMPVISHEHVLGVFELFSDKPSAFTERDLLALERLAEMVETAVQHSPLPNTDIVSADIQSPADAVPVRTAPPPEPKVDAVKPPAAPKIEAATPSPAPAMSATPEIPPAQKAVATPEPPVVRESAKEKEKEKETSPAPAPKKALFWSAAMRAASAPFTKDVETISVPVTLRNLQKCQACGFPVSQGRSFCVECEEKQWRGQRVQPVAEPHKANIPIAPDPEVAPQIAVAAAASHGNVFQSAAVASAAPPLSAQPVQSSSADLKISSSAVAPEISQTVTAPSIEPPPAIESVTTPPSEPALLDLSPAPVPEDSVPFLSATLQSESWFSANKYVLAALLLVAVVIGAVAWLR
jgi:hypothetical protein